jgi:hypothetical protein
MKNLRRTTRHSRKLISPLLICSLFFLIMCPFAHSLTPCSQAPVLIPQKHVVENGEQQKDHVDLPHHHSFITLPDCRLFDKTLPGSSTTRDQEGLYSLTLITSSRLIL